uniref:Cytochrome P450 n=1 Tax=Bionectria ochroleuca TaxID=29856 RepID=A0A8H7N148_BIOOC
MPSHFNYHLSEASYFWAQTSAMQAFVTAASVLVIAFLFRVHQLLKAVDQLPAPPGKKWKLPPGPRGLPYLGNLLLYSKEEKGAHEIAKYGEMVTTHLGSKLWVVLNSNRLAHELYAKHGKVTNGRPPMPIVNDLLSQGRRSVMLPIDGWAERRRVMHKLLSGTAMTKYAEYQAEESVVLLANYLRKPQEWYAHNARYANSVIYRITFGEKPKEGGNLMKDVTKAQFLFLLNAPPFNFWDCFPGLAKLPKFLQWWRGTYERAGKFTHDAYFEYYSPIKRNILEGKAPQSFARDVLLGQAKYQGSDTDKMFLTMQLVEAGSDTTRLAVNIAILAASVADAARLPDFGDEESLPYINAFAKEILRWRRIFVWTPEHTLTENLEFEGYYFPRGTSFVINHASISENPDYFEDPLSFKPERWLDGNETDLAAGSWQFGGGRRLCVGYKLAQKSIFINLSRLFYCFNFEEREPFDDKSIQHFTMGEPFPINVKARGEKWTALIERAA